MNYIRHLNGFFSRAVADSRLLSTHISLYMALFQHWNYNRFEDSFTVYRLHMMQLSKLGSKNTYRRCMMQLQAAGYLRYYPALRKGQPAKVSMRRLDQQPDAGDEVQLALFNAAGKPVPRTEMDPARVPNWTDGSTNSGTPQGSKMVPLIKHINSKPLNSVLHTPTQKPTTNEEKTTAKDSPGAQSKPVPDAMATDQTAAAASEKQKRPGPTFLQVELFFVENSYPKKEALKFWLYNEGRGWQLAPGQPIRHWQPLAHKWMLGALPDQPISNAKNLFTDNDKNYDAPL